jgi:hypothetical protein
VAVPADLRHVRGFRHDRLPLKHRVRGRTLGRVLAGAVLVVLAGCGSEPKPSVTLTFPANGSTTVDAAPTFVGMAGVEPSDEPPVRVRLYVGTKLAVRPVRTLIGIRRLDGSYSIASPKLTPGTYTAQAEQRDDLGRVGKSLPNTFTIGSAYWRETLADEPVAYWRLGEDDGTVAADEAGTSAGVYSNGVTIGRSGALTGDRNTAASFDGFDGSVTVPSSRRLNLVSGVTLEAWLKRRKSGSWQNVVAKPGSGATAQQNYALWLNPSSQVVAYFGNGSSSLGVYTPDSIDTSWHHLVATYDNATARIYVDGVLRVSTRSRLRLTANSEPLTIGRSSDGVRVFGGLIDEVAVYGRALSASRIREHYRERDSIDRTPPIVSLTTPGDDSSTVDARPHFAGGARVTSSDSSRVTVRIYRGSSAVGRPVQSVTTTRLSTGAWSVVAEAPLPFGAYTARAEQSDLAGNIGKSAPSTFSITAEAPSPDPVVAAAGDIADCADDGDEATASLLLHLRGASVLTLGDNAYPSGSRESFADCYAPSWGRLQLRTRPALGDHDYGTPQASGYFTYFARQLARFGRTAIDPTRGYYSYDLGSWRVVVLNGACGRSARLCDATDQAAWLDRDLASHPRMCTLAILHPPRFSSGAVHGNNATMRRYWEVLYGHGVDVILSGDEHLYERYAPQDPDGLYDPEGGLRQFIVGTGGGSLYSFARINANSEVRYNGSHGILRLTLHPTSYEWEFMPTSGSFSDAGTTRCH